MASGTASVPTDRPSQDSAVARTGWPLRPHKPRGGIWTSGIDQPDGVAERGRVAVRPALLEQLAELADRPRALGKQGPTGGQHLLDVEPGQLTPVRAAGPEASLRDHLEDGPQGEPILRGQQVDRGPHHRGRSDGAARLDQSRQLLGPEIPRSGSTARRTDRSAPAPAGRRGARSSLRRASPRAAGGTGAPGWPG